MANIEIKNTKIYYTLIEEDNISVDLGNTKIIIPVEKITGKPVGEKDLTNKAIRCYFENNRLIKKYIRSKNGALV